MSATQTGYGDEKIESPAICTNILDNYHEFSGDKKNSEEHDIENENL